MALHTPLEGVRDVGGFAAARGLLLPVLASRRLNRDELSPFVDASSNCADCCLIPPTRSDSAAPPVQRGSVALRPPTFTLYASATAMPVNHDESQTASATDDTFSLPSLDRDPSSSFRFDVPDTYFR